MKYPRPLDPSPAAWQRAWPPRGRALGRGERSHGWWATALASLNVQARGETVGESVAAEVFTVTGVMSPRRLSVTLDPSSALAISSGSEDEIARQPPLGAA